jgi:acetoacetyl-CoA synthetase
VVNPTDETAPLWTPDEATIDSSNIAGYIDYLRVSRQLDFRDYHSLWQWSVADVEAFWASIWEFFGLGSAGSDQPVLGVDALPGAQWFPAARLNFAGHLLGRGDPARPAVISVDEAGNAATVTWQQLRRQVASLAQVLRGVGVTRGDVVVGYLPNGVEAVVAFLATASLGAIWSSVGLDYAAPAVIDRFAQLRPKVLVAADGYRFNGTLHSRSDAVHDIATALGSTLQSTIIVARKELSTPRTDVLDWNDVTAATTDHDEPVVVDFSHPLWVLFSSGTTGVPKGIVHSHGGMLIEMLKQLSLHWDLSEADRVFWYTSPSWVMWNLQVSTLLLGGSIVCYDGSPTHPDVTRMWRLVADQRVTFFGTSPGYLKASERAGLSPGAQFDLDALRGLGCTGSPLAPDLHRWASEHVGPQPLWSMSGGTDVASAICGGVPTVPIWPGELSARCLGVAADSWGDDGQPVRGGGVGEMVITRPMPSMPINLWDDPTGERYRAAYFSTYPGVWRQGDWITITDRDSVVIHGRSDATLNRNGIRMGSADIYAAVEEFPQVVEALVVGVEQADGGYWMPMFVALGSGYHLDDDLTAKLKTAISQAASPRHVPDDIVAVRGIPHTRTGKKLEVPVKRILQGSDPSAVVSPGAVDDATLLADFSAIGRAFRLR